MNDHVLLDIIRTNRNRLKYLKRRMDYKGVMHLILFHVKRCPGTSQEEIVNFFALDKTTVARDCRRVEEMGHLIRTQDPENRRKNKLYLTPEGEKYAERLEGIQQEYSDRLKEEFTEEEWVLLEKLLDRLTEKAGKVL